MPSSFPGSQVPEVNPGIALIAGTICSRKAVSPWSRSTPLTFNFDQDCVHGGFSSAL
ncbi:MAG: hypothetical protein JOZ95_06190 [Solirubrobacterales bacterium]|nr:hypothetical protein [Solirubrobacterales bacterium]